MAQSPMPTPIIPKGISGTTRSSGWNSNYTTAYEIDDLVIIQIYVQGTPSNNKKIMTGLPKPDEANTFTTAGSPPSVILVNSSGELHVSSAGTGVYLGGTLVYRKA